LNGYRVCAGRCVFVHAGTTRQVWDYQDFWSELSKAFIKIACIREMPLSMLRLSQVSLLGPFFVKRSLLVIGSRSTPTLVLTSGMESLSTKPGRRLDIDGVLV
jgi:hypothetical protein